MAGSKRISRKRAPASVKAQHQRYMTWLKRGVAVAIIALAAALLYNTLSGYSREEIVSSITAIPGTRLAFAGLFARHGDRKWCLLGDGPNIDQWPDRMQREQAQPTRDMDGFRVRVVAGFRGLVGQVVDIDKRVKDAQKGDDENCQREIVEKHGITFPRWFGFSSAHRQCEG